MSNDTAAHAASDPAKETPAVNGILWLASYPKSGNTWTRNFLHNLLNILEGVGEEEQDINAMNEFTFWEISARPYEKFLEKKVTEATREEISALRPKVQALIAESTDGLAMVKTHHALVMDRGTPTINFEVTSGAVYIVRNPLDVSISLANHISGTIDDAIHFMGQWGQETAVGEFNVHEIYGSWSQHVESWTKKPHRAVYVMRYENMLADPMRIFMGLAHHLLLDPTEEQLRLAVERSSFDNLKKQEDAHGFREKPDKAERFFRAGRAGEWRERLSPDQVRRIVQAHHV
ncbi:MAG: sulfotransferase domain-containing protein, partial [Alphaproteobacteria bacterium]|nr:sulfotransferase domain-containing protein [Alphaproteobacteria bacterium]